MFASKNGTPTNPDWYYNVVANPEVEVEVGTARLRIVVRVADNGARGPVWARQKQEVPQFAAHEAGTERTIPVIALEPR